MDIELISSFSVEECCAQLDASLKEGPLISFLASSGYYGERNGETFTVLATPIGGSRYGTNLSFNGFLSKSADGTLINGTFHAGSNSTLQRFAAYGFLLIGVILLFFTAKCFKVIAAVGGSSYFSVVILIVATLLIFLGIVTSKSVDPSLDQRKLKLKMFLEEKLRAHSFSKVIS